MNGMAQAASAAAITSPKAGKKFTRLDSRIVVKYFPGKVDF